MSTHQAHTYPRPTFSTSYLQHLWHQGKCLSIHLPHDCHFTEVSTDSIAALTQAEGLAQGVSQSCVLVGQGINIELLLKIVLQYFSKAHYAVVNEHYLNGKFAQQAVAVTLYQDPLKTINEVSHQVHNLISTDTLTRLSRDYYVDAFAQSMVRLSEPGLLVMDMDSTIINMECIDEIAGLVGVGQKVSELTERAMLGELDFNQSLQARVLCLKGVEEAQLEKLKSRLPINPGFAHTIALLQHNGWVTCIASGGFTYFADYLKDTFALNEAISNTLSIADGKLTGMVEGDIVNGERKKQVLLETAIKYNIPVQQTIAIGDGANDLLMMGACALGVAYKAKPKVQASADANIHYCGFEGLLYCLQA